MECGNCGKHGHTFRDCKDPVMSFGICAVKFIDDIPHYLMIRRRDSLAYVEFLRGKYRLESVKYIETLIQGMTKEERERLVSSTFDKLWENLWFSQITRQFRNEYENAKRTFEAIKHTGDTNGKLLIRYIDEVTTEWVDAEWGFPKGRRSIQESETACALREFAEETGIAKKCVTIVKNELPLYEEYIGTNGIPYKQIYYIGVCNKETIALHQPNNKVMSREVGNIGWFSYEEAFHKIRETNKEKRVVLTTLHTRVQSESLNTVLRSLAEWNDV
jgi:8-oxo-dGTP pyrophosphatase MutT (NUDIX family)